MVRRCDVHCFENVSRDSLSPLLLQFGELLACFFLVLVYTYLFGLSSDLMEKRPFLFDQKVIDIVRFYTSPAMDGFMYFITEMGSTFMLGLLLVISMIWLLCKT